MTSVGTTTLAMQRILDRIVAGDERAKKELIDLASERLGPAGVAANDDFFASKDNLIRPGTPQWRDGEYTDRGKWMDGWETR